MYLYFYIDLLVVVDVYIKIVFIIENIKDEVMKIFFIVFLRYLYLRFFNMKFVLKYIFVLNFEIF